MWKESQRSTRGHAPMPTANVAGCQCLRSSIPPGDATSVGSAALQVQWNDALSDSIASTFNLGIAKLIRAAADGNPSRSNAAA